MKVFAVLFAFLAVQGLSSAATIGRDDLLDLIEQFQLDDLAILDYVPIVLEALGLDKPAAESDEVELNDPSKCVPYIQEAYNNAVEVRRLITEGVAVARKVYASLQKCKEQANTDAKKKCARETVKAVAPQGKAFVQAYKVVKPKVLASMDKFEKCLA